MKIRIKLLKELLRQVAVVALHTFAIVPLVACLVTSVPMQSLGADYRMVQTKVETAVKVVHETSLIIATNQPPVAEQPFRLLSAESAELSNAINDETNRLVMTEVAGNKVIVKSMRGVKIEKNPSGTGRVTFADGSVYTLVGKDISGPVLLTDSSGTTFEVKPSIASECMLVLAIGAGIIILIYIGYRLYLVGCTVVSNWNRRTTNIIGDQIAASAPPFGAFKSSAMSSSIDSKTQMVPKTSGVPISLPNICPLKLPEGMTMIYTNLVNDKVDVAFIPNPVPTPGWTLDGDDIIGELLVPMYPTNVFAVDRNGGLHSCVFEHSTNLVNWSPFVGSSGTVALTRKWFTCGVHTNYLEVTYLGGIACCTNYGSWSGWPGSYGLPQYSNGENNDTPIAVSAGLPKIPGASRAFFRLSIKTNLVGSGP